MEKSTSFESTDSVHLLPAETIDNIIDHLHDDVPALSASSLVHRAWLPSCRYHLFGTIHCNPRSSTRALVCLRKWLLASPDVHPYIKTIVVSPSETDRLFPAVIVEELEKTLLYLPLLHGLVLRQVVLSSHHPLDPDASYVSSTRGTRRLRTLVIAYCTTSGNSFDPICRVLGLFEELDELTIRGSTFIWNPEQATRSSSRLLELARGFKACRALTTIPNTVANPGLSEMICYLLENANPADRWALQELRLRVDSSSSGIRLAARIVQHCRETLQNVLLDVNHGIILETLRQRRVVPAISWPMQGFHDCLRLKAMQVGLLQFAGTPGGRSLLNVRISILAANAELVRHAPPSVETVTLAFLPVMGETFDFSLWEEPELVSWWCSMDNALADLPALRIIKALFSSMRADDWVNSWPFEGCGPATPEPLEKETSVHQAFLKRVLPRAYGRGIVRIDVPMQVD